MSSSEDQTASHLRRSVHKTAHWADSYTGNILQFYSEGSRFDSRPRQRLYWLKHFVQANSVTVSRSGHHHFLLNHLRFIILLLPYYSTLYVLHPTLKFKIAASWLSDVAVTTLLDSIFNLFRYSYACRIFRLLTEGDSSAKFSTHSTTYPRS